MERDYRDFMVCLGGYGGGLMYCIFCNIGHAMEGECNAVPKICLIVLVNALLSKFGKELFLQLNPLSDNISGMNNLDSDGLHASN